MNKVLDSEIKLVKNEALNAIDEGHGADIYNSFEPESDLTSIEKLVGFTELSKLFKNADLKLVKSAEIKADELEKCGIFKNENYLILDNDVYRYLTYNDVYAAVKGV